MTQFWSVSGASYISVEGSRLQAEGSRKKYVKKYEKNDERTIQDGENIEDDNKDSSRTKRQSIIVEAKLKIIRNVWHKFYHLSMVSL